MTTPVQPLPYNNNAPKLTIIQAREDFFNIWQNNVVVVRQVRLLNVDVGNYGSEDASDTYLIDKEIYINLQGDGTNDYSREKYGIDTSSKSWHAYCLHTEDLVPNDRLIYAGSVFIIENLNQGITEEERAFWEFDIKSIDKDESFLLAQLLLLETGDTLAYEDGVSFELEEY